MDYLEIMEKLKDLADNKLEDADDIRTVNETIVLLHDIRYEADKISKLLNN